MKWQKIETAPKDKDILIATTRGSIAMVYWNGWKFQSVWGSYSWFHDDGLTHWHPLPEPPTQENAK